LRRLPLKDTTCEMELLGSPKCYEYFLYILGVKYSYVNIWWPRM